MLSPKFDKLSARNPQVSARQFNALMANLRALSHSGGIDRIVGPAGIHQRRKLTPIIDVWLGGLWYEGPASQGDYSDERYWVREWEINSGAQTAQLAFTLKSNGLHVTASNLDELYVHSHDLITGQNLKVFVFLWVDVGGMKRYMFSGPAVVVN